MTAVKITICFIPICPIIGKKHAKVRTGFISRKETEEEIKTSMSDGFFTAEINYKLFDEREVSNVTIHVLKLVKKVKKLDCLSKLS